MSVLMLAVRPVLRTVRRVEAALALVMAALVGIGATGSPAGAQENSPFEVFLKGLEFRSIGPAAMGGRVADLAVDESDPSTFYVGVATGGLWKTTNHGASFEPLFDDQPTSSIGDVTLAPSNPDIVWVGTGEPQNRQSSPWGMGVFKSVDGGATWTHMGLQETRHISRIQIHPTNPEIVYVAAVGHLWGPNPERGVYGTTDGGATWERVLYVDEHTGAIDLAMDLQDPRILYAAMYQRRRTNFGFNGGGPGSGIFRTRDGGATWQELTEGLPEGDMGRIGLDIYRGDPRIVYAIVEAMGDAEGIYRSADRGATWEQVSETNPRPMYYSQIRIDPTDPERIYLGGTSFYISSDGGRTFEDYRYPGVHVDHHAIWIDPGDSDHLLLGNDGGVYASFDRGASWRMYDNMALGQYYEIGVDMSEPYNVCGGLQDNGTWCGPNETYTTNGILNGRWGEVNGGDGFYARIDPTDPSILFAESQNGNLSRIDLAGHEGQAIRPEPKPEYEAQFESEREARLRFNWNSPLLLSHHDPSVVYYGSNLLFRSPDRGHSWVQVSPDLTRRIERDSLTIMGVKLASDSILSRNDGISSFGNATTIAESPLDPAVLYVGTDDGNLQVTRDGGATWANVVERVPELPRGTYVSRVVASHHAAGRVYASFDGHTNDDFAAYVYVSEDYGRRWRRITGGLPAWSVNSVAEHPADPELLFVGNEVGVYVTMDRGRRWTRMANLPTVPVDDIIVHPRDDDLVLGTHGRSVWILDDLAPLRAVTDELLAQPLHLFELGDAVARNLTSWEPRPAGAFAGTNPPRGAVIRYWLGRDVAAPTVAQAGTDGDDGAGQTRGSGRVGDEEPTITVTILDAEGEVVRELEGPGTRGLHQVVWDLRTAPPYEPPEEERGGFFRRARGIRVLPGSYTVRLEAGSATQSDELEMAWDPRVEVGRAELEARWEAARSLFELVGPLYLANQRADTLNRLLADVKKMVDGREDVPEDVVTELDSLRARLDALDDELGDVNSDVRRLYGRIEGASRRPTEDQLRRLDEAWDEAPDLIERLNAIIEGEMPVLYRRLDELGIRPDPGEPVDVPRPPGSR
ncbi:MAG: glycosyl hydrolase [Gemmatimonadota bacterium]|nr:MAG: glycosyl hydrolase [Gemmatimonadota bacterium]